MDWGQIREAALLIALGMAVVFAALVILMASIMIMNRLFPDRGKKTEGSALLQAIEDEKTERQKVAVVAVAVAKAMERESPVVVEQRTINGAWSCEASRWAVAGREQVMRSRGKAGRQWGRRSD